MNRTQYMCSVLALFFGLTACNERIVKTTSIGARLLLSEPGFNLAFVESVEIFVQPADPTKPFEPRAQAPTPVVFGGLTFELEAKDFDGDGKRETRLKFAGNPFARTADAPLPAYNLVFSSESAGRNPMKLVVNILKGSRVIARGVTEKNIEGSPIVLVDDERRQVEVQVRCAADFACDTGNQAPALTPIGNQLVPEGQEKTVMAVATDPDGHAIKYSLTLPDPEKYKFITINETTGALRIAPLGYFEAGVYPAVVVNATDAGTPPRTASETITVTVGNTNRAPKILRIGGAPATEGMRLPDVSENQQVVVRIEAEDSDPTGNQLTYSMIGLPPTAILNPQTGFLQWIPAFDLLPSGEASRDFPVTFTVTDSEVGTPLSTTLNAIITVKNVNRAPAWTTSGAPTAQTVAEGALLTFQLGATDEDNDTLTYNAEWADVSAPPSLVNPDDALNHNTGVFSWTPGRSDQRATPYRIRYTVRDPGGLTATGLTTITVINTNFPPVVSATETTPVGSQRCSTATGQLECNPNEDEEITLALTVADDAEDAITTLELLSPSPAPEGSSFAVDANRRAATFKWRTTYSRGGDDPIPLVFRATDQHGASGTITVPVTIINVNRPPVLTLTEQTDGAAKCSGSELLSCSMLEGQTLTVAVDVADDAGETVQSVTATSVTTLDPTAGTFALTTTPTGARVVTFEPSFSAAARAALTEYVFRVTATDGGGEVSSKDIVVRVSNDNRRPSIVPAGVSTSLCPSGAGTTASPLLCTINEGAQLQFSLGVTDADFDHGDSISIFSMTSAVAVGPTFVTSNENKTGLFTWTPGFNQGGYDAAPQTYNLTFSARDSQSGEGTYAVKITVRNVNRAPKVTISSGTVSSATVCNTDATPTCFVDVTTTPGSGTRSDTLVLRLNTEDPDNNGLTLTYTSSDLPQLGPVFDPIQRIFSFTPPVTTTAAIQYTATFTVKDDDAVNPLSNSLNVIISVNSSNREPVLTRLSCPTSVIAGASLLCSLRIDDYDPRDTDLNIFASFINGGSFSYAAIPRVGTFIMVPPVTDWGIYQVDFTGSDGTAQVNDRYIFSVQRSDIAAPSGHPVIGGEIDDVAFNAPYLFTANGGFVSTYNVPTATQINTPQNALIPAGAKALRVDSARNWLYVLGEAIKAYDVSQGILRGPLTKFNLPDGPAATTFATRSLIEDDVGSVPYAFVGYPQLNQIDVIRLGPCTIPASGSICPARIKSLSNVVSQAAAPPALAFSRLEFFGNLLGVIASDRILLYAYDVRLGSTTLAAEIKPPTTSGVANFQYGPSANGKIRRPDVQLNTTTQRTLVTVPTYAPNGYVEIAFDSATGLNAVQTLRNLGTVPVNAVARAGNFVFTASGSQDVRRYSTAGVFQGTVTLAGDNYADFVGGSNIGFAISQPTLTTSGQLSLVNLTDPANPVRGVEKPFSAQEPGVPAIFVTSTTPKQALLYAPRAELGVEVYDVTTSSLGNAPINLLGGGATTLTQKAIVHGTYLLAHATTRSLPNVKHALVYNLATTAISPPELTTVGFQFAASPSQMVPFTGTANQLYVYMFGSLCRPSCTSGAPTAGTWLLELTSGGVQVRNATGLDLGGNDLASLDGVLVNGTAFYRVRGTGVSKEIGIYDITNPLAPQFRSARALTGVSVSTSPRIAYGAGVLMVAGGAGASGGDGVAFLSVGTDPTQLTLRGKVLGIGDAIAVAVLSATRAFVSSSRVGVLRLDLSDLDHPKIQGGQEAPNNAITSLSLQRAGQRRCCDGRVSCLNTSPCTSDATCTAPATCQDVNLLLAGESTNISVFELLP